MNIEELYRNYSIEFVTPGEHKHAREGWVNTECPFCSGDNPGYHLGYETNTNRFACWRGCTQLYPDKVIAALLNVNQFEAKSILQKYGALIYKTPDPVKKVKLKAFRLPEGYPGLACNHIKYLIERDFDPLQLGKDWGIYGTGPFAVLDDLNYKHRIIIPYIWNDKIVSFDSRDITDKSPYKYMACSEARELIPHKSILYGRQDKWGSTGICVEGPTDVWRLGFTSFAVSGIKFTPKQVRCIAKHFKRVPVIFDGGEPQAIKQANTLVSELKFRGVDSFRVDIEGDPGGLSQKEADYLVKQLI